MIGVKIKLEKVKEILLYAKNNNTSIKLAEQKIGVYDGYVRRVLGSKNTSKIQPDLYQECIKLREQVKDLHKIISYNDEVYSLDNDFDVNTISEESITNTTSSNVEEVDVDADEEFKNARSRCWEERNQDGKIVTYHFEILIRDQKPFVGFLSRSDMEKIHSIYPFTTINGLSQEFISYTAKEMARILRVFNITKDNKFPKHVVEEYSKEEIAKFALNAKERAAYKTYEQELNNFFKIKYHELVNEHNKLKRKNDYYDSMIDDVVKRFDNKLKKSSEDITFGIVNKVKKQTNNTNDVNSIFSIFSDIHFGKINEHCKPMYGRTNNKEILRERCLQIASETANAFLSNNNFIDINFICLGDVFESAYSEGMHSGHLNQMDLKGADQIEYGYDVFLEMIDIITSKINESKRFLKKINIHLIGGNHDRIAKSRDEDKDRTATRIMFKFLEKTFKNNNLIKVHQYDNGIMQFSDDNISFVGHHGDKGLIKRRPEEIMNLYKKGDVSNFTVIANGHFHSMVQSEGLNYLNLQVGSVCSSDDFTHDNLGFGNQPSFVVGHKSFAGYGFDFKKITLY